MNIYDFEAINMAGKTVSLSHYKDYVIVIVNTATRCGFAYQFKGLEQLYQQYKEQKFVVLGFPSNQFKDQEPDNNDQINETCQLNFGVTFPLFQKVDVKGDFQHPVFTYLTNEKGGFLSRTIKWNFTKFIIDRNGRVVKRFAPTVNPEKMQPIIEKLL